MVSILSARSSRVANKTQGFHSVRYTMPTNKGTVHLTFLPRAFTFWNRLPAYMAVAPPHLKEKETTT